MLSVWKHCYHSRNSRVDKHHVISSSEDGTLAPRVRNQLPYLKEYHHLARIANQWRHRIGCIGRILDASETTSIIKQHPTIQKRGNGDLSRVLHHTHQPPAFVGLFRVRVDIPMASLISTTAQPYEVRWFMQAGERVRSHTPVVKTGHGVV